MIFPVINILLLYSVPVLMKINVIVSDLMTVNHATVSSYILPIIANNRDLKIPGQGATTGMSL